MRLRNTIRAAVTAAAPVLLVLDGSLAGTLTAVAAPRHTRPPPLALVEKVLLTTVKEDFDGDDAMFGEAMAWQAMKSPTRKAPHLACAEYSDGRQAMKKLEGLLSKEALRRVSNHKEHGACFFATADASERNMVMDDLAGYRLTSFSPVPSALKLAPGLLNHEGLVPADGAGEDQDQEQRLTTTHGNRMRFGNVAGLDVALSPGVLPAHDDKAGAFIAGLLEDLMSASMDLHANSFWSDSDLLGDGSARPAAALRGREWRRAAAVVHELSAEGGPTPGDVCSWGDIQVHHASSDLLLIKGVDHLLHLGRGAGGKRGAESDELQMACLMGLVSFLAMVPEVQRVSPFHASELKNAVAGAIVQSGNIQDKPLTAAGLDGTGEIVQIIDTGLDETSCFFIDEDGLPVDHGYYFEALGFVGEPSLSGNHIAPFKGGSFPFDLSRRKIVQYIRMVRDDYPESPYGEYGSLTTGRVFPWYEEYGFGMDMEAGHGTHTAGSVAGETLSTPAETVTCPVGGEVGCIGICTSTDTEADNLLTWNRLCPQFDCDGFVEGDGCLSENVAETLTDNGGVARGAKISVFDASIDGTVIWASLVGNGLWNATSGTGCMLHSNSWGADGLCSVDSETVEFDKYMYENPEHLLLFAAGNDGAPEDSFRSSCTINIPGIGKNVMAVGSSSSGPTRWPFTASDGDAIEAFGPDHADIDTVSFFSSYGLTKDSRIKPEILAPGDQVLSAGSDGTGGHSCQLAASQGTSMSTPIAAGAAAMVRQYFKNSTFYEADVTQRGLCAELTNGTNAFACEAFSPSAATVKAMLVNSADLMGGDSEPDGYRGFGRVRLEGGLPLGGEGDQGLFVADAFQTEIEEYTIQEYEFNLLPGADIELRATLAWLDPPATAESSVQLINDLDLTLVAPDKITLYRMWSDGADNKNVIERVILPSSVISEGGTWTVAVSCFGLTADTQPYSLVVTGPIDVDSGAFSQREATGAAMGREMPSMMVYFVTGFAVMFGMLAASVPW